jgi:hypothetical protein
MLVEVVLGEGQQLGEELAVLASGASRIAGFEQEREARCDTAGFEAVRNLIGAFCR